MSHEDKDARCTLMLSQGLPPTVLHFHFDGINLVECIITHGGRVPEFPCERNRTSTVLVYPAADERPRLTPRAFLYRRKRGMSRALCSLHGWKRLFAFKSESWTCSTVSARQTNSLLGLFALLF